MNWFFSTSHTHAAAQPQLPVWDYHHDRCQATTQAGAQCPYGVAAGRRKYCNIHGAPTVQSWDYSPERCQGTLLSGAQCPYGVACQRRKYCNVHGR